VNEKPNDDVAELTRLNHEFTEHERQGASGAEFFSRVLADDLCFRRANGAAVDKPTFLQGLEDPGNTSEELTSEVREVGVAGDWALAEVIVRLVGTRGGRAVDGTFQNVRVFQRTEDGWRCAVWFNRRY
jgi:ketosteroid isomerase-like protein